MATIATYRVGGDAVGDAIGIGGQLSRMAWEVGDAIGMAGQRCYWRGSTAKQDGVGGQLSRMAWEVGDAIGMGEWEDRTATRTLNSIALLTTLCT